MLDKDLHSGQGKPTSSLIEGTLSSSIDRGPPLLPSIGRTALAPVQSRLRGFLQDYAFPCGSVLTVKDLVDLSSQECVETGERIFPPLVTLCPFLSHIHRDDPACRAAVARLHAPRGAHGLPPGSPLTGGYCKARQRLPESWRHRLLVLSGQRLKPQGPAAWHWHGRAVKIVDGSAVSRPDTEENHQAYPQPGSQAPGLGFPGARIVVVLSVACGAVCGAALGRLRGKQPSDNRLFHTLHTHLERGDVVLAERSECSYGEIPWLGQRGIDVVMRLPQRRQGDFQRGRRWGRADHGVTWSTPGRPAWMDEGT